MPRVGKNERALLDALEVHGYWHQAASWHWRTRKETEQMLDALVNRALVFKDTAGVYRAARKCPRCLQALCSSCGHCGKCCLADVPSPGVGGYLTGGASYGR